MGNCYKSRKFYSFMVERNGALEPFTGEFISVQEATAWLSASVAEECCCNGDFWGKRKLRLILCYGDKPVDFAWIGVLLSMFSVGACKRLAVAP